LKSGLIEGFCFRQLSQQLRHSIVHFFSASAGFVRVSIGWHSCWWGSPTRHGYLHVHIVFANMFLLSRACSRCSRPCSCE
jgi:hypothetical protein